jgi:chromosome segregation ATPase
LNESISDPRLRTFRMPITVRLREKLDAQRDALDAQAATIHKQSRDITRLERDLKRARKQINRITAEAEALLSAKGVTPTPEILSRPQ